MSNKQTQISIHEWTRKHLFFCCDMWSQYNLNIQHRRTYYVFCYEYYARCCRHISRGTGKKEHLREPYAVLCLLLPAYQLLHVCLFLFFFCSAIYLSLLLLILVFIAQTRALLNFNLHKSQSVCLYFVFDTQRQCLAIFTRRTRIKSHLLSFVRKSCWLAQAAIVQRRLSVCVCVCVSHIIINTVYVPIDRLDLWLRFDYDDCDVAVRPVAHDRWNMWFRLLLHFNPPKFMKLDVCICIYF